jgi:hypothetical protein
MALSQADDREARHSSRLEEGVAIGFDGLS